MRNETDVLILGAGLAGLSAASVLGDRAVVLEREARPGGLVRTHYFDGYWFDHVIHLLYFPDPQTEARVRALPGLDLEPCTPVAWVETGAGTVQFPFQMHLSGLNNATLIRCLQDLAEVTYRPPRETAANFEQLLLDTFGRGMCDVFMLPYNRKMWKRPLDVLATRGFTWNITRPDFEQVLRGAVSGGDGFVAYNAHGWYPRPPAGAPQRGMEVLSRALAARASDVRLGCEVRTINADDHTVTALHDGRLVRFPFDSACLSTLPLPLMLEMCPQTPPELLRASRELVRNRVMSVALSIRGPRPPSRGHWRYYADESLCFNRLVYMNEFDPELSPPDGWGLLAELTEPAEQPMALRVQLTQRVCDDVVAAGALPQGCTIEATQAFVVDPAYVVFTERNRQIVQEATAFLTSHGVTPLGRYGKWEYSSMGQVMRDGFAAGDALRREQVVEIADVVSADVSTGASAPAAVAVRSPEGA